MFVLPLLRENETPGCPIQRVLENDFVVVTGTGSAIYKVGIDDTTSFSGNQSLKMQFVGDVATQK
jgi:hypothetical protein